MVMRNGPAWFETTRYAGLLTMRSDRPASKIYFATLAEPATPHGEEAQSAVSNHEGPAGASWPSSFETREDALLRMRI
jgi:hypothetical protein